jgi:hypothetical protein
MRPDKAGSILIDQRRERVAESYLRGRRQYEIAEAEGVVDSVITKDLQAIRKKWRESSVRDFDEHVSRELDKIDLLEREHWEAWERSKKEKTVSRTSKKTGKNPADEASIEKQQRDGNPAFLEGVLKCIERRCKLLGLDAPEKFKDVTDPERRRDRLDSLLASLRERAGAGATGTSLDGIGVGNN